MMRTSISIQYCLCLCLILISNTNSLQIDFEGSGDLSEEIAENNSPQSEDLLKSDEGKLTDENTTQKLDEKSNDDDQDDVQDMELNSFEFQDMDSYEETWNKVSDNIVVTDAKGDVFEQQKCHKCLRTIWQANHLDFCGQCERRNIVELGRQKKQHKERCTKCDREKFKERHLLFCQENCVSIEEGVPEENVSKVEKKNEKRGRNKNKRRKDSLKGDKNQAKVMKVKKNQLEIEENEKKKITQKPKEKNSKAEKKQKQKNKLNNSKKQQTDKSDINNEIDIAENEIIEKVDLEEDQPELGTIGKLIQYWIKKSTPGLEG